MAAVYGVDVHDGYQAGLSFNLLYQQGYRFCAVKLTEGTGYVRAAGDDWIRAARTAGLMPGAYHWLTAADGAAQARWFFQQLQQVGGPAGLLIQLDCEDDGYGPQIRAWAGEWNRLSGGHPFLIYSGAWWWPRTGGFNGASVTPYLWDSHYLTADLDTLPDDPAAFAARIPAGWWSPGYGGWSTSTLLQFTSRGDAGALANKVDLNVYRGTVEQLRALTVPTPIGDDMTPEEHGWLGETLTLLRRLTVEQWPYPLVENARAAADGLADVKAAVQELAGQQTSAVQVDAVALANSLVANGDFLDVLAAAVAERLPTAGQTAQATAAELAGRLGRA